jgi:acyl-CoA thioesterase-2
LDRLARLLDLEQIERDVFRGANPGAEGGRLFGGQVASQALRAAQLTVEADHQAHSVHSFFLRPGRYGVPILLRVDRIRDGKSFSTRRVVAWQKGEAIFNLDASFHGVEDGPEFALPAPTDTPAPDEIARADRWGPHHDPIDSREVDLGDAPARRVWFKAAQPLPDDLAIHACVITYATDMGPMGAVRRAYASVTDGELGFGGMMGASLDHVLWFHRPVRADEWLLYDIEAVATAGARGLARGTLHTADGVLVASVAQEVLLRTPKS